MRIEHFALWARDIEKMRAFYLRYFEAKSNERYFNEKKQYQSYFLSFEGCARLELMQRPDIQALPPHGEETQFFGYVHLALSVGSEAKVDELTARLVADGYPKLDGPRWTGDGYYESVVLDPEGNRIEITA